MQFDREQTNDRFISESNETMINKKAATFKCQSSLQKTPRSFYLQ